jgi:hypothetical protein
VRNRWACAGAAVALLAGAVAGCTGDGEEQVSAVAPGALAEAAAGVTSGRFEVVVEGDGERVVVGTGRFDGDDSEVALLPEAVLDADEVEEPEGAGGEPAAPGLRTRVVGGVSYVDRGGDQWLRIDPGDDAVTGPGFGSMMTGLIEAAREAVVSEPGSPIERDGRSLTRYVAELTGDEAVDVIGLAGGLGGAPGDAGDEGRLRRILRYRADHSTVRLAGDVDRSGRLVRLEVEVRSDLAEYPDCLLFAGPTTGSTILDDLGEPQGIEAPPADRVIDFDALGADVDVDADAGDDPAGGVGDEPEAEETIETAAGPVDRSVVLEAVRAWAEERGIDWRQVPVPDDAQLAALYDAFVAGPAGGEPPDVTVVEGDDGDGDRTSGEIVDSTADDAVFDGCPA